LFPFHQYGSRPDTFPSNYAAGNESLHAHCIARPFRKKVHMKSRDYRARITFSTCRHRQKSSNFTLSSRPERSEASEVESLP
jgi:hypothetical protein